MNVVEVEGRLRVLARFLSLTTAYSYSPTLPSLTLTEQIFVLSTFSYFKRSYPLLSPSL